MKVFIDAHSAKHSNLAYSVLTALLKWTWKTLNCRWSSNYSEYSLVSISLGNFAWQAGEDTLYSCIRSLIPVVDSFSNIFIDFCGWIDDWYIISQYVHVYIWSEYLLNVSLLSNNVFFARSKRENHSSFYKYYNSLSKQVVGIKM